MFILFNNINLIIFKYRTLFIILVILFHNINLDILLYLKIKYYLFNKVNVFIWKYNEILICLFDDNNSIYNINKFKKEYEEMLLNGHNSIKRC